MKIMGLDLNNTIVPYKEFYGKNVTQMPNLIREGRVPLNVAGLMEQRLRSGKNDWKDNYFDTGDAVAYHPDGRVKFVLDSQTLRGINAESKLQNNALVLGDGVYEQLEGLEFARDKLAKITERDLVAKDIKANPIWQKLARDESLLNEYVDAMSAEMKKRWNYDDSMGIYLASAEKVPTLRSVFVFRLESGSLLYGGIGLDSDFGRLVGVAPEALGAPNKVIVKPSLETALSAVNEQLFASSLKISK